MIRLLADLSPGGEIGDALASGASGNPVEVQVLSRHQLTQTIPFLLFIYSAAFYRILC